MIEATAEIGGLPQKRERAREWQADRLQDPDLMQRLKAVVEQTLEGARLDKSEPPNS